MQLGSSFELGFDGWVAMMMQMGLMVKPPRPGTVSYPQHAAERCYLFTSFSLTDVLVDCHIPFFLVVVLQILFHDMPLSQDLFFFVCKLDVSVNQYWIPYD